MTTKLIDMTGQHLLYGGRGIKVCERWQKFENFLADMGEKPNGFSLDRLNNELGYFAKNCRWATANEQANNKSNNRRLTYKDRTLTVSEWEQVTGLRSGMIRSRVDRLGWSIGESLGFEIKRPRTYPSKDASGKFQKVKEIATSAGV